MPSHDFSAHDPWGTAICGYCGKYQKDEYKTTKCSRSHAWKDNYRGNSDNANYSGHIGWSSKKGLYGGGHYGK